MMRCKEDYLDLEVPLYIEVLLPSHTHQKKKKKFEEGSRCKYYSLALFKRMYILRLKASDTSTNANI